ncbi:8-oxo-dGTP pyrophosphatase MutT (NUDIX family) [Bradyrhizobium yuanmingense]|uniref:8-oxo-dGTP pyrophosphatase MutT (NUDIX family) n=1 Tax=Bradyrhizobium yuanmingense TaxID=108015 RepID=A0ABV4GMG1_9BRAD
MTTWRPHPRIRVVAIGLHWRGGRLLAAEVRDDAGRIKGVRPLGGEIEFGESWRAALVREFNEELGIDVGIMGEPLVMENIFVHEASAGHEVMFIAEVAFPDGAFAGQDPHRLPRGQWRANRRALVRPCRSRPGRRAEALPDGAEGLAAAACASCINGRVMRDPCRDADDVG